MRRFMRGAVASLVTGLVAVVGVGVPDASANAAAAGAGGGETFIWRFLDKGLQLIVNDGGFTVVDGAGNVVSSGPLSDAQYVWRTLKRGTPMDGLEWGDVYKPTPPPTPTPPPPPPGPPTVTPPGNILFRPLPKPVGACATVAVGAAGVYTCYQAYQYKKAVDQVAASDQPLTDYEMGIDPTRKQFWVNFYNYWTTW